MRKYLSFGETNLKYRILSEKKKSDGKFPIKKIQSADFDRVGRVRGNKLIFNFGLMAIELNAYIIVCLKKLTMRLNSAYKFEPLL
jgi:hypothetical protein